MNKRTGSLRISVVEREPAMGWIVAQRSYSAKNDAQCLDVHYTVQLGTVYYTC